MELFDKNPSRAIATAAVIAAVYAVAALALAPFSFGLVQFRVSEALTVLPALTPLAIPGLFVGCLLANLLGMTMGLTVVWDILFGSAATLIAAILSRKLRKWPWLVPLPPVLVNAVIIGWQVHAFFVPDVSLWLCMLAVGAGQAVVCYVLGMPVYYGLRKTKLFNTASTTVCAEE